jgi:hypothetical protein
MLRHAVTVIEEEVREFLIDTSTRLLPLALDSDFFWQSGRLEQKLGVSLSSVDVRVWNALEQKLGAMGLWILDLFAVLEHCYSLVQKCRNDTALQYLAIAGG